MTEAIRNPIHDRYDLIPAEAVQAWAERMGAGALSYSDENWKQGLPGDKSPLNHIGAHLTAYQLKLAKCVGFDEKDGDTTPREDLGAILCNVGFELYFRAHPDIYAPDNRQWETDTPPLSEPLVSPCDPAVWDDAAADPRKWQDSATNTHEPKLNFFEELLKKIGGRTGGSGQPVGVGAAKETK